MRDQATQEILEFWFGADPANPLANASMWWKKDPKLDDTIRERFEKLVLMGLKEQLENWKDEPESCLAYILLLDQFTRNIYRGTPEAFSGDPQARIATEFALRNQWDHDEFSPMHRHFMYMPLMHSEELTDQEEMVRLDEQLLQESKDSGNEAMAKAIAGSLDYAIKHREVIERFGRFPHRNEILDRKSKPEEIEFLKEPGSSF